MDLFKMTQRLEQTFRRFLKNLFKWHGRPEEPSLDNLPEETPLDNHSDVSALFEHPSLEDLFNLKIQIDQLLAEQWLARHKLNLLIGPDAKEVYLGAFSDELTPLSTMIVRGLSKDDARRFRRHFPRISHLVLVLSHFKKTEVNRIVRMLRRWSGSLQNLVLIIGHPDGSIDPDETTVGHLLRLFAAINSLEHLQAFTFKLDGTLFPDNEEPVEQSLDLPILARLEYFVFSSHDYAHLLVDSMVRYLSGNTNLTFLRIWNPVKEETAQRFLQIEPHIAQCFRGLSLNWHLTVSQLDRFCTRFTRITYLNLYLHGDELPLPVVARRLRSLSHLQTVSFFVLNLQAHIEAIQEEAVLEVLPQVVKLEVVLFNCIDSHDDLRALQLETFFPNTRKLTLSSNHTSCSLCDTFPSMMAQMIFGQFQTDHRTVRMEACVKLLLASIRPRFSSLQEAIAVLD